MPAPPSLCLRAWTPSLSPSQSTAHEPVSGLWQAADGARACLVLAHGAGAGMTHRAMAAIADGLAERGVATLRYQFPYMEKGGKRVDPPPVAHAAVRAAVAEARRRAGELPLFAGGKSFGGRMTSQAQALGAAGRRARPRLLRLPAAPGRQAVRRRAPSTWPTSRIPMLFLQGTKDLLADRDLLEGVVGRPRRPRDPEADRGRRPFLPRPGQDRPQGRRGAGGTPRHSRGLDGADRRLSGAPLETGEIGLALLSEGGQRLAVGGAADQRSQASVLSGRGGSQLRPQRVHDQALGLDQRRQRQRG